MFIIRILDGIKNGIIQSWEWLVSKYKWVFAGMVLFLIIPPIVKLFL